MKNKFKLYMIGQWSYHVFILGFLLSMSFQNYAQTEFLKRYNSGGHHVGGASVSGANDKMSDQRQNGFVFALSPFDPSLGTNPFPTIFTTDLNGEFDGLMMQYSMNPSFAATSDSKVLAMRSGTTDDGFFLYGDQYDGSHTYFIRTNNSGVSLWANELEVQLASPWLDTDLDNVLAIQLADGNILVTGAIRYSTNSSSAPAPPPHDLFVMKLHRNTGNVIWKQRIESSSVTTGFMPRDLIETTAGNYYIVGGGPSSGGLDLEDFLIHIQDLGTTIATDLRIFPFGIDVSLSKILFESSKLTIVGTNYNSSPTHMISFRIGTDLNNFESLSGVANSFTRYSSPVDISCLDAVYLNDRLNVYFRGDNSPTEYFSNGILVLGNDGTIVNTSIGEEYPFSWGSQIYKTNDALYTTSLVRELGLPFFDHFRLNRWSTLASTCLENPYTISLSEKGMVPHNAIASIHEVTIEYITLDVNEVPYTFTREDLCVDCDLTAADVGPITTSGGTSLCETSSITLYAPTGAGYSYQWFKDGFILTGETTSSLIVTEGGDYSVVITDSEGCEVELLITIDPGVDLSDVDGTIYCIGGSYLLPDYGDGGVWSGLGVSEVGGNYYFSPLFEGTHIVTYCLPSGCCDDATITIGGPSVSISGVLDLCESSPTTLTALIGVYPDPVDILWSPGGETTSSIVVTTPGTYTVTVTGANEPYCSTEMSVEVLGDGSWHKTTENTNGTETTNDVVTDAQGNVYVTGIYTEETELQGGANPNLLLDPIFGSVYGNMYVAKYNECGTLIWAARTTESPDCSGNSLVLDENNGVVYVTGDIMQFARFHDSQSEDNLCTSGTTIAISPSGIGNHSSYVAQYDMMTGCLYFAEPVYLGAEPNARTITINEMSGDIFIGGQYLPSYSHSKEYAFAQKYSPTVGFGTGNVLGSVVWQTLDNVFSSGSYSVINDLDFEENDNLLYGIGTFRKELNLFNGTLFNITNVHNKRDAFLVSYIDGGMSSTLDDGRNGNGSPNGDMEGNGIAVESPSGKIFLTGTYSQEISDPFHWATSGINPLNAWSSSELNNRSYMIGAHPGGTMSAWARQAKATPSASGWAEGKDVAISGGKVFFLSEFSGNMMRSLADGIDPNLSKGFIGDPVGNAHLCILGFSMNGNRNWMNVTASPSSTSADDHKGNSISADVYGHCFVAGEYNNNVAYDYGTPASGDLSYSGIAGGYNGMILRVEQLDGELKNESTASTEDDLSAGALVYVYPNPSSEFLYVEISNDFSIQRNVGLKIINILGETVYEEQLTSELTTLQVGNFSKGTYIIQIDTETTSNRVKFVKN